MRSATISQLEHLLNRLKTEQHELIDTVARDGGAVHRADLHTISELENAIAAVIALIDERQAT